MVQQSIKQEQKIESLTALYEAFESSRDYPNAEKMKQLVMKLHNRETTIAFCGHFSAGKSSMINYLLGDDVLPSSPIPTSANTVKLQRGGDYAKVYYYNTKPVLFPAPYDYREVKAFCKDGDRVSSITISSSEFPLPETCAVMDTPGIDSTDDAHRVATESALHLADVIFYVMDYNHVQSEVNFHFTKELQDANKSIYLIVNMIDKHDDTELGFAEFKSSVIEAFANWGVYPNGFFFTSVRNLESENNQIQEVKEFIFKQGEVGEDTRIRSVMEAAERLVEEHAKRIREELEEENAPSLEILAELPLEEQQEVSGRLLSLIDKKDRITKLPDTVKEEFDAGLESILKNAYIMPAQTRDLAAAYLESNQPEFKVGLFFSKKKTEEERENRERAILSDLQEKVKTQLEWHLKELAAGTLKEAGIYNSELEKEAQGIEVAVSKEMLVNALKSQVSITGEYVLNYTNEIAAAIKKSARNEADRFIQTLYSYVKNETVGEIGIIEKELKGYARYQSAFETVAFMNNNVQKKKKALLHLLASREPSQEVMNTALLLEKWLSEENDVTVRHTGDTMADEQSREKTLQNETAEIQPSKSEVIKEKKTVDVSGKDKLQRTAADLKKVSDLIQPLKGFHSLHGELKEKAARLQSQTFTVALFGAFSAGKSSFANAMMGESVLPVSPNPTTAAINKIMAPKDGHPHGTATITLKTAEMLLEDVSIALSAYDIAANSLDEAFRRAGELMDRSTATDTGTTHLSFIKAFVKGFPEYKEKLGTNFPVGIEGFKSFAAEESKSCFVDLIELYYDCELTKQGIVLVDTPGADSINARHTGAAFEYIKNSDAILFVTYYNHPFSRADREFLIQLGRVKDSFAMDKMFFIINAVDLAQTSDELNEVTAYVQGQLNGFGIRFPKLFPLSSKGALAEKLEGSRFSHHFLPDSGLPHFESQFNEFIENDLTMLALQSSKAALSRVLQLLEEVMAASLQDERSKSAALAALETELGQIKQILGKLEGETEKQKLRKEIDELAFYSKQRVFFRFADFFKESFNPAVLKDDGRDMKAALRKSLKELLGSLGFDLSQEMRATALRSELFVGNLLKEKQATLHALSKKIRGSLHLRDYEPAASETMEFKQAFEDLDETDFKKELAIFKNTKSFFEKNDKIKMSEALQAGLEQPALIYTADQRERMYTFYSELFEEGLQKLKRDSDSEIDEIYNGLRSAFQETIDVPFYESILKEIKELT
ncbi:dynamin family protein [Peribacillus glennii]|uniref:Dynamin family protein n=1 Tax=Peribacillus glennii TaxID=2303991 RepID=A0A372LGR9_9BACI|nr:dynamin family protein [Peribacillus glennii]RFU65487.1 Dynamin family protein [Peribacillus glennii]